MTGCHSFRRVGLVTAAVALFAVATSAKSVNPDWNTYIEDPGVYAEHQLPPHVPLTLYDDENAALAGDHSRTRWQMSLNGTWQFKLYDTPQQVPDGFFREDFSTAWDSIPVPGDWQAEGFGHPMYRNVPMDLTPYDPPKVPDALNPTAVYRHTFELPPHWGGRRLLLHFGGVKSNAFVYLNGEYVGYDQGGMTPAEYDVTPFLHEGQNTLVVAVNRWCDGSYLEDQDMWRFSGIYRAVTLYAVPNRHLRDHFVHATLAEDNRTGQFAVDLSLTAYEGDLAGATVNASLFDAGGNEVWQATAAAPADSAEATLTLATELPNVAAWSAEKPHLYALVLALRDGDERVVGELSQKSARALKRHLAERGLPEHRGA